MLRRLSTSLSLIAFSLLLLAVPAQAQMTGGSAGSSGDNADAKEAAREVAQEWLTLTDAGEFGKSWDQAAAMMQNQVERKKWKAQGQQMQKQLQDVESRSFAAAQYRESIPKVDGGPFVMVQYKTDFATTTVQELVITTQEEGEWKVAGYTLRPMRAPGQGGPGQGGPGQGGPGSGGPGGGGR